MALGVRCLCFRIYSLRRRRSSPQTLLVVSLIMIFISIAAAVSLQWIIPQYVTFGHQTLNGTSCSPEDVINVDSRCKMSQLSEFLKSVNTAMPIFGSIFLIGNFIFLVAWCVTFITAVFGGNPTACLGQEMSIRRRDSRGEEGNSKSSLVSKDEMDMLEMSERKA